MSEWPTTGVALVHRNLALYLAATLFDVTIVTPADAAVLTTAEVDVTWAFSPGTQQTFRVEVLEGAIIVYDSGIVATVTQAHTIPEGNLETGAAYTIRVTVTTTDSNTGQGSIDVTTAFAPATNVVGVALEVLGDKCELPPVGEIEIPSIRVSWTEVVPQGAEVFVRYSVWRREAGEADTDYVRIASIVAIATTTFIDRCPIPYATHEYAVTWTATDGGDTLVSVKQDPPAFAQVQNDFVYITEVGNATNSLVYFSLSSSIGIEQDTRELALWGRQRPTMFVGEQEFRQLSLAGLPALHRGTLWDDLTTLVERQRTAGIVLCVQVGFAGLRFFMNATSAGRDNRQKQFEPRLELVEVHFEEGVP